MARTLTKYARQHFYHIFSSLCRKLSCKMSLLVMCKILGVCVNTLTTDDKYSLCNSDNLPQPIQRQLSNKNNFFLNFLLLLWSLDQILNLLERKMSFIAVYFRKCGLRKRWLDKYLKTAASEHPSRVNMLKGAKHC